MDTVRDPLRPGVWTRRGFLQASAVAAAGAGLAGCATNPVSGRRQFLLLSEQREIAIDQEQSPHQFSQDFGVTQDRALNEYLEAFGGRMVPHTHRPQMPFSFQAVNAVYVNAYAFPGGSIAFTRGILLDLEDEAQLAALCGHEIGHVSARHAAARITKGLLAQIAVAGAAIALSRKYEDYADLGAGLGMLGAGVLLAHYSRQNEREADRLGMEYMVLSGYDPEGMVGLMDLLVRQSERDPSLLEVMFSTHPMSRDRRRTARRAAAREKAQGREGERHRERYMDHTASLRSIGDGLRAMQRGNGAMSKERYAEAEDHYAEGLRLAPDDYAGLLSMAHCLLTQERKREARAYIERAQEVYPGEPRAVRAGGLLSLHLGQYAAAREAFLFCDQALPGDPSLLFLNGRALEGMGRREEAARAYASFLNHGVQGQPAEAARNRLVEWGYIKPAQ